MSISTNSAITEHSISLHNIKLPARDVTTAMEVFYNPVMKSNRNISILLLNSIGKKNLKIADPLAGSGIRSLRFLKELKPNVIKALYINDKKPSFLNTITSNLEQNNLTPAIIEKKNLSLHLHNQDANLFLLQNQGFDYIDIDPFGTPNPFLAAAVSQISRNGILAITATDTAALTGTYPKVTKRKYWATSFKSHFMHEVGLRILIRKVQLQGIQFDKALTPILAYHKDHYFRIYFRAQKSKIHCDDIISQHQYLLYNPTTSEYKTTTQNTVDSEFKQYAGPLWTGSIMDKKLITKMAKLNLFLEEKKFLQTLMEEASHPQPFFYDLHILAKKQKITAPKLLPLLAKLNAVRTHFSPTGFKTTKSFLEVSTTLKKST